MPGFLVIDTDAARRLRGGDTVLSASDVLASSGDLRSGGRVHVVVRGRDGGQGVLATATMRDIAGPEADAAAPGPLAVDASLVWPKRR